ncbi:hypothetical protein SK128_011254 [Halocaridina rubra]|uniref:Uncharacterized protein n=1 Tax=Halocaridina rubra TaxID=373956 RepID=A0AAN8WV77_HALRR
MKKLFPVTNPFHVDEEDIFSVIRNIDTVQVKYEVYLTLHELKDKHAIKKIFEEYAIN